MIYEGDAILPGGRGIHGKITTTYESDTNVTNVLSCDLSWPNGDPLTADEDNEDLGGIYLHEFVTDALMLLPAHYEEDIF